MKNWQEVLMGPNATLRDALATIDAAGAQIALVVDSERRMLGTLSDGDIRRGLLRGLDLSSSVSSAMHVNPTCLRVDEERQSILSAMRRCGLHQVPLVDSWGRVVGLEIVDDFLAAPTRENRVVIMAGGIGARLHELTQHTPKPMLKVGPRPLLETIVRAYADQGFVNFYFAVNYKADQIESHFGDGRAFGVHIAYLREKQRMGTAGALSLLEERPESPLVVTNADLLTKEDYGHILDRHIDSRADATMAVRDYEMQVPFGVVHERDGKLEAIDEKPVHRYVVSAGMYVLSPQAVELVPPDCATDMPALFEAMVARGMSTRCHHTNGYWLDIGRIHDYERANMEFPETLG